jgi:hypothetical protein
MTADLVSFIQAGKWRFLGAAGAATTSQTSDKGDST